jgi:hypothetical protein
MSVPGPPWTPEENGLLRSLGAASESATAIAMLLKRKAAGAPASSPAQDQVGPFAARAEAEVPGPASLFGSARWPRCLPGPLTYRNSILPSGTARYARSISSRNG